MSPILQCVLCKDIFCLLCTHRITGSDVREIHDGLIRDSKHLPYTVLCIPDSQPDADATRPQRGSAETGYDVMITSSTRARRPISTGDSIDKIE